MITLNLVKVILTSLILTSRHLCYDHNPYIEGLRSLTLLELRNDPLPNSTADAIEMKES